MLEACSHLSLGLLQLGRPFRGCITQGTFYAHLADQHSGAIVAGNPVLEAYEWEGRQGWIGIMVRPDKETEESLSSRCDPLHRQNELWYADQENWPNLVDRCETLPVSSKRGCKKYRHEPHYAVVPSRKDDSDIRQALTSIGLARDALLNTRDAAPATDWSKYDVTKAWYDRIERELVSAQPKW